MSKQFNETYQTQVTQSSAKESAKSNPNGVKIDDTQKTKIITDYEDSLASNYGTVKVKKTD